MTSESRSIRDTRSLARKAATYRTEDMARHKIEGQPADSVYHTKSQQSHSMFYPLPPQVHLQVALKTIQRTMQSKEF